MKNRTCYLFVFDGFSDWEPSMAIAGLNQFTDFTVRTVSVNPGDVKSMGGVTVKPDTTLADVSATDIDLLILPGGNAWDEGKHTEVKPLVDQLLQTGKTVAAICAGTSFLAQQGYLDKRPHTSNHLDYYLKKVAPQYAGEHEYVKEHVVTDGNLITANGTAIVPFAEAIFNHFNLLEGEALSFWFQFFQHPEMCVQ